MLDTHIVRLGTHAEKDYLVRAYAWFDEVALNANLVEATASSLGMFLNELREKGKGYFIDPVTYAYALAPDFLMRGRGGQTSRTNLKRTFRGLAERYGSVIDQYAGRIPLQPNHLDSEAAQDELCQCVLDYQRNKLNEALSGNVDFLMMETEIEPLLPTRFVVPYFHLSGDLEWLPINTALANRTYCIDLGAWVVVCIDSLLLDFTPSIDSIVSEYSSLQTPGYLVWATDFEEERATEGQIRGLQRLIEGLSQDGKKQVINLFGGYFSCLLAKSGLTGVSHGLGYGERRDIIPVLGGGLPPAKYYLPATHQQIRIHEFAAIASKLDENSFPQTVCNCAICSGLLRQGLNYLIQQYTATDTKVVNNRYRQAATPQVYRLTRFHYLSNKNIEFQRCRDISCDQLLAELDSAYQQFRDQLGTSTLMYLRTWRRALTTR
ncbi:MAG: hypothetical protein ISS54_04130 [Dehalococcoidia bacterium]|nr:hypothetical protein [Dehalococcoidia bacterium]